MFAGRGTRRIYDSDIVVMVETYWHRGVGGSGRNSHLRDTPTLISSTLFMITSHLFVIDGVYTRTLMYVNNVTFFFLVGIFLDLCFSLLRTNAAVGLFQSITHTHIRMHVFFARLVWRAAQVKPRYIAMAFDVRRDTTFRRKLFHAYKAQRKPVPVDLSLQVRKEQKGSGSLADAALVHLMVYLKVARGVAWDGHSWHSYGMRMTGVSCSRRLCAACSCELRIAGTTEFSFWRYITEAVSQGARWALR